MLVKLIQCSSEGLINTKIKAEATPESLFWPFKKGDAPTFSFYLLAFLP